MVSNATFLGVRRGDMFRIAWTGDTEGESIIDQVARGQFRSLVFILLQGGDVNIRYKPILFTMLT